MISQGDGELERNGESIRGKKLSIKFLLQRQAATGTDEKVRVILLKDMDCMGTANPASIDDTEVGLLEDATWRSFRSLKVWQ